MLNMESSVFYQREIGDMVEIRSNPATRVRTSKYVRNPRTLPMRPKSKSTTDITQLLREEPNQSSIINHELNNLKRDCKSVLTVEGECPCTDHCGIETINEVFPMDVKEIYDLIFHDNQFYKSLLGSRGIFNIECSPWAQVTEKDVAMSRCLTYKVPVNNPLVKNAFVVEEQKLMSTSNEGEFYQICSESSNKNVPYGDTFVVRNVWCLIRGTGERECRIRTHTDVVFTKFTFGLNMLKGKIQRLSMEGNADFFKNMVDIVKGQCLRKTSVEEVTEDEVFPEPKTTIRRKKPYAYRSSKSLPDLNDNAKVEDVPDNHSLYFNLILCLMVLLFILHIILYYYLIKIEKLINKS